MGITVEGWEGRDGWGALGGCDVCTCIVWEGVRHAVSDSAALFMGLEEVELIGYCIDCAVEAGEHQEFDSKNLHGGDATKVWAGP